MSCASLALTATAPLAHAGGPAICSAKHRRPANLYGSVLSDGLKPALAPAAATTPPAQLDSAPVPPITTGASTAIGSAKPTQVSRAELKASFAPCDRGRA